MLLAEFNEAQPEWPEGVEPMLAVIPVSQSNPVPGSMMTSTEVQERLDKETVFGIGFHPQFIQKLDDWISDLFDEIPPEVALPFTNRR